MNTSLFPSMTSDLEGMFKPISLYIGLRYTRARRSNHFISFIALVSMVGLTLGVAVLITVLSVMNGFDRELKNRVLGMVPQATVSSTQILTDWPELVKRVENHPHVTGVAPFTQLQGMLTAQGQVAGIMVTGIDLNMKRMFLSFKIILLPVVSTHLKKVSSVLYLVKTWPIRLV
jgi:lipoprotein-releasing system permease protein